jgi:hypothetical protein
MVVVVVVIVGGGGEREGGDYLPMHPVPASKMIRGTC